ncbi:MAG: recombinase family protein, partial [Tissierellia bacterium]|nr:recombinase family protein [Tissierellia bacterium]
KSKLEGYSNQAIAEKLNELGYLSPMAYKRANGINYKTGFSTGMDAKWTANSIGRILKNKVYIGVLEQGKRVKINYKIDKRIETSPKDWIVVENAHEPIISKEMFHRVQDMSKRDFYLTDKSPKLFSGMLYCMDCGSSLLRRVNKYKGKETVFYICSEYNRNKNCTRHSIRQDHLEDIVVDAINLHYSYLTDLYQRIVDCDTKEITDEDLTHYDQKLVVLQSDIKKYRILKSSLYEDLQEGIIDEEEFSRFRSIYTLKIKSAEEAMKKQESLLTKAIKQIRKSNQKLEELKSFQRITKLTRKVLVTAIDKIYIGEEKEINIIFHGSEVTNYLNDYIMFLNSDINAKEIKEAV